MKQEKVAEYAEKAVAARKAGRSVYSAVWSTIDLDTPGMCSRFTRQCSEMAAGVRDFQLPWFGANAKETEKRLFEAGLRLPTPVRGCLVAFSRGHGEFGHIVVYLGNSLVAENTLSGSRGDPREPGAKISRLDQIPPPAATGYFLSVPDATAEADQFADALRWAQRIGLTTDSNGQSEVHLSRLCEILRRLHDFITAGHT